MDKVTVGMEYVIVNRKRTEFWMRILVWLRTRELNIVAACIQGWLNLKRIKAPEPEMKAEEILESLKWFTES